MARTLAPIPIGTPITDKAGLITSFFRLRWQELLTGFLLVGNLATIALSGQTAAIGTTNALVTTAAGWYRVSYYLRKTIADGVSSSLTVTLGWTDNGSALSETEAALTTDTTLAQQSGSKVIFCDANSAITYAVAYASNTPNKMTYNLGVILEQFA